MRKIAKASQKKHSNHPHKRNLRKAKHTKIILKISGEFFGGKNETFNPTTLQYVAQQIEKAHAQGVKIGIVIGGGNIIRGRTALWLDQVTADFCGMMATVINGLVLYFALRKRNVDVRILSAIEIPSLAQTFSNFKHPKAFEESGVTIFVGGTGNPFFTTDTAAALRAAEIGADILIKGTKVEGVYSADPEKNPKAQLYRRLKFDEVITKKLGVMDLTAFNICQEADIPICVYNFMKYPLRRIIQGEEIGTLITNGG